MEEALVIAERCENGREAVRQDYAAKVTGCMTSVRGQVASVHSVTDYGGLRKAIHSLTEEMRDMKVEMKLMAGDNQRLRLKANTGGWRGSPSSGRSPCYYTCGGYGCQSQASYSEAAHRTGDSHHLVRTGGHLQHLATMEALVTWGTQLEPEPPHTL